MFIVYKNQNGEEKALNLNLCQSLYIIDKSKYEIRYTLSTNQNERITELSTKNEIREVWSSLIDAINNGDNLWKSPDLN